MRCEKINILGKNIKYYLKNLMLQYNNYQQIDTKKINVIYRQN